MVWRAQICDQRWLDIQSQNLKKRKTHQDESGAHGHPANLPVQAWLETKHFLDILCEPFHPWNGGDVMIRPMSWHGPGGVSKTRKSS